MTTAYWCVLITMILPYVLVLTARLPDLTLEKNLIPRLVSEQLTGFRQRTFWAHLNALEIIAPFSAAIIIAHLVNGPQETINELALTFVAFRIAHALCYMANLGVLRTLMFASSYVCIVTLFIKVA